MLKRLFGPALAIPLLLSDSAGAVTIDYDMVFRDPSGKIVGNGRIAYDDQRTEDLYIHEQTGLLCDDGPDPYGACEFRYSWTPLTKLSATVAGREIFKENPYSIWLEGSFSHDGRYNQGTFFPGEYKAMGNEPYFQYWIFDSETVPNGVRTFEAPFFYATEYLGENEVFVSGTVKYKRIAPIPLPASGLIFGSGLLLLGLLKLRRG